MDPEVGSARALSSVTGNEWQSQDLNPGSPGLESSGPGTARSPLSSPPCLGFQIGHRDLDVEKRLRRDLRRTHALLSDVQLLLATTDDGKTSVSKEELEKVHSQVGSVGPPSRGAWHAGVTGQGSGATGRCEGWWGHLVSSSHGGQLSVCAGVHLCERCLVTARAGHQRNSSRASKGTVDRQWPFVCPDANGPAPETWGPLATPSRAPVPREVSPCPGHMALGQ